VIRALSIACLIALLCACGGAPRSVQHFAATAYPAHLSDWGVVSVDDHRLSLSDGFLPYDLNTPLFSDYAHKLRAVWLPQGTQAHYSADGVFEFPVGTIVSKTFYYPRAAAPEGALLRREDNTGDFSGEGLDLRKVRLIETRLLVRQESGWDALAYVWDAAQQQATLEIAGDMKQIDLVSPDGSVHAVNYVIPTRNECANCHATDHASGKLHPIGLAARHLNKAYEHYADGTAPQLQRWVERGYLDHSAADAPANALWRAGADDDIEHRARSYLDVNCGHCHNPRGAADTSGLFLNAAETSSRRLGLCKPPIAAGRGTGGRHVSVMPGQPDASILIFRVAGTDPGIMMPELGRTTVHEEGVALLRRWVESLPGVCT
jgi:uncharacterized repeat protein (TIGR03806 family)